MYQYHMYVFIVDTSKWSTCCECADIPQGLHKCEIVFSGWPHPSALSLGVPTCAFGLTSESHWDSVQIQFSFTQTLLDCAIQVCWGTQAIPPTLAFDINPGLAAQNRNCKILWRNDVGIWWNLEQDGVGQPLAGYQDVACAAKDSLDNNSSRNTPKSALTML